MKKALFALLFLGIILIGGVYVSADMPEIKIVSTKNLTSGNGICEDYKNEFSMGEKDTIAVNGELINIEYLGNKDWKLNDYQGKIQNHDFFVSNQNSKLRGARFDFSFMDQSQPEGNLAVSENNYYPWDCQGFSQSTGLVAEIKITEGWNLVPFDMTLRDIPLEGELSKDDILVSYFYVPELNEFINEKDLERRQNDPAINAFFSEENEGLLMQSSKWIYVKPGAGNKKVIGNFGAYIPYRNQILSNGGFKLEKGWNFLFVDAFMIFDDSWSPDGLKIKEFAGNCSISKSYGWDAFNQNWVSIGDSPFYDEIGLGFIVKVDNECTLGSSSGVIAPPTLPSTPSTNEENTGLRKEIENYYYTEYSYEGCVLNEATNKFTSKEDCYTAMKCISVDFAKLIKEQDLAELANYMKEQGGESGVLYYENKYPDTEMEEEMKPIYNKCLAGKYEGY